MTLKQEHVLFGLLGLGAVAVLYMLWRESQANGNPAIVVPGPPEDSGVTAQPYPNVQPIKAGDFIINGFGPDSLPNVAVDGHQLPRVEIGGGNDCPCDSSCAEAGMLQSIQTIPDEILQGAVRDLNGFTEKVTSGVDHARVSFTQA